MAHKRPIDIQDVREKARALKSAGILPPTYDVRKVHVSHTGKLAAPMSGGRTLTELVSEFDDVLSDKAVVVSASSLNNPTLKKYRKGSGVQKIFTDPKSGKRTDYVIVPKYANEYVTVTPDGNIVRDNINTGIRRMEIPVEYHNLRQWVEDSKLEALPRDKGYTRFGVRFWGGYTKTFRTWQQLWDEMEYYTTMQNALSGSPYQQREMFRNFELVEIKDTKTWNAQREKAKIERARAKRAAARKRRKKNES